MTTSGIYGTSSASTTTSILLEIAPARARFAKPRSARCWRETAPRHDADRHDRRGRTRPPRTTRDAPGPTTTTDPETTGSAANAPGDAHAGRPEKSSSWLPPAQARPGRTLAVLAVASPLRHRGWRPLYGLGSVRQRYQPRLGSDLEGGTSVITLTAPPGRRDHRGQAQPGGGHHPQPRRQLRVVAEAEVTTAGDNIVISIPGKQEQGDPRHRPADRPAAVPASRAAQRQPGHTYADAPGHAEPTTPTPQPLDDRPATIAERRRPSPTAPPTTGRPRHSAGDRAHRRGRRRPPPRPPSPTPTTPSATAHRAGGRHPASSAGVRRARLQRTRGGPPAAARTGQGQPEEAAGHLRRGRRREVHPRPGRGRGHRRHPPAPTWQEPGRGERLGGQPRSSPARASKKFGDVTRLLAPQRAT